jgi:hypothetical protein
MTDFWKEIESGAKCVRLVEQLLREEEKLLAHLKERGYSTNHSRFKIARMKYALGETSLQPNWKDYFHTEYVDNQFKE